MLFRSQPVQDAASVPIIALSANAFEEDVKQCLDAGMNAHLSKPIEPERLYETMARLIQSAEEAKTQGVPLT